MAEYIERDALVRQISCNMAEYVGAPDDVLKHDEQCNYAISCVESAPAADVAPVVRCKDCASTRKKDDYESIYLGDEVLICTNGKYGWQPVWPNHFCGYGCPKDGDDDAEAD